MGGRLTHSIQQGPGESRIVLSGEITEDADFTPLLSIATKRLVIDLSQITRINSSGLREWIEFARGCNRAGAQIVLERCSPIVVTQLNMIWNFAGKDGQVRSVYAPYYCPRCDLEHLELIDFSKDGRLPGNLSCPKCGAALEFEDVSEVYLHFRNAI